MLYRHMRDARLEAGRGFGEGDEQATRALTPGRVGRRFAVNLLWVGARLERFPSPRRRCARMQRACSARTRRDARPQRRCDGSYASVHRHLIDTPGYDNGITYLLPRPRMCRPIRTDRHVRPLGPQCAVASPIPLPREPTQMAREPLKLTLRPNETNTSNTSDRHHRIVHALVRHLGPD